MDPFRDISIRAAWRADFQDHLPLGGDDFRRLRELPDGRERTRGLLGMRQIFGRFRLGGEGPDALGLQPFVPPV
jgi:hypothetical protein